MAMDFIRAKKSFGQNFLKDENVLKKIATSFNVTEKDLVIEIGPGMGALTKYLVKAPSHLLCYEIDTRFQELLMGYQNEKCRVIFDDFLNRNLKHDIKENYECIYVIANIPYYITTPIIEHILESHVEISGMTLLVQKEVASRFAAKPKSKDYGYFTVYLNHFFDIQVLFDVPNTAFNPPPKVTSSVVLMKRKEAQEIDILKFQKFLKDAFSQKRKTLKNNLKDYDWEKIRLLLQERGLKEEVRAEEISYEDFVWIFKYLGL